MNDWNSKMVSKTPAAGAGTIHRGAVGAPVAMAAALPLTFQRTLLVDLDDILELVTSSGALGFAGVYNKQWLIPFFKADPAHVQALHVNYFRQLTGIQFRFTGIAAGAAYPKIDPIPIWKYLGDQPDQDELLWQAAKDGGMCRWKLDRTSWHGNFYFQGRGVVETDREWDELVPLDEASSSHWFALDVDWEHAGHGVKHPEASFHAAGENYAVGVDRNWEFNFWGDRGQEP